MGLRGLTMAVAAVAALTLATPGMARTTLEPLDGRIGEPLNLTFRDTDVAEVYEMLSRLGRVNIMLGPGAGGQISVNLFEVSLEEAIHAVGQAAGLVVESRGGTYFVVGREDAGKDSTGSGTLVRTFKVQYTDPELVATLLEKHLSRFGKVTAITPRSLLVVEDRPDFLRRIEAMIAEIDIEPRQILIEAKILEIALDGDQTYGIDWRLPFKLEGGPGVIGQAGLAATGLGGFFVDIVNPQFEVVISALRGKGRVRTLSTPKLLVLENQEAEVVIGDRIGFKVTTTINQVTTESVEFIESGVILKVSASVDRQGRILLDIHPEVSTGTVNDGIPSVATTEVTTSLLADSGQKIFIGGLIKNSDSASRTGVPVLSDLPVLGGLFSTTTERTANTETVVLITPYIIDPKRRLVTDESARRIDLTRRRLELKTDNLLRSLPDSYLDEDGPFDQRVPPPESAAPDR